MNPVNGNGNNNGTSPYGPSDLIVFDNVSKFYGDVLGVNQVNLSIPPGITSLVGPNGSGKTTLMNLLTGLLEPSKGAIQIKGISPREPERLFGQIGYSTQYDSFPRTFTGFEFVSSYLRLYGFPKRQAEETAWKAIERVGMIEAAHRKIAGYSKGMRQRIRLAQSMAHDPHVLVLDEPLNGLDPLVRAETIALFRAYAREGRHLILSSHILHEVDMISDQVILINGGYILAEGRIHNVRGEIEDHPLQILVRCKQAGRLGARLFEHPHVVEVKMHNDRGGLLVKTRDPEAFYRLLNQLTQDGIDVESVAPADDDVHAVYEYLIGTEEPTR